MSFFRKKQTIKVFSNDLSLSFNHFCVVPLVKEYIEAEEEHKYTTKPNWKFDLTKSIDKLTLLEEWIVFEMFLFGQAILEYYKGNQIGAEIVRTFNSNCINTLIEFNVIKNEGEFEHLLSKRYSDYLAILKKGASNNIYEFSKDLLSVLSRGDSNIIYITIISRYYFDTSAMYLELFSNIMKEVELIEE